MQKIKIMNLFCLPEYSILIGNCIGKKKHTLANKTTPKLILMEHKMCLTICIVTKPHLGKVCIFLPILFVLRELSWLQGKKLARLSAAENLEPAPLNLEDVTLESKVTFYDHEDQVPTQ